MSDQGVYLGNSTMKAFPLDPSSYKPFKVAEASEEVFQSFLEAGERALRSSHFILPDIRNHPAYQDFARVMVNGKEVARVNNHGVVTMPNSVAAKVDGTLPNQTPSGGTGPTLAKMRAEVIARAMGGTIKMAETAITQQQYDGLDMPKATVDEEAVKRDPEYQNLQDLKKARLLFLAQQLASQSVG
ncbi:hypothetical protein [Azospirillum griseum]|uniref:Uncharacterized protein n=1 Tax=Azospirillum griseum TaxID=2496639 RepID=A0A3S0I3V9_9PROT|nr:hypothetical protein [Azospirillum griseum]RTR23571.1 hypothetical protein EJ903_03305 [Azospirillum griseum]